LKRPLRITSRRSAGKFTLANVTLAGEPIGDGAQKRIAVEYVKLLGRIHQRAELLTGECERGHDGASRNVDLEAAAVGDTPSDQQTALRRARLATSIFYAKAPGT
jgi:hypothetical protein